MRSSATERSRQLLEFAEQLLDDEGPHALSLRRIADAVGTSTQAVYTEFGGKPGLADALFRAGYRRLADHLATRALPADPIERLVALGRSYRHVARSHPAHYEVMTARPIPEYRPPPESLAFAASTMTPLRDAVAAAVEADLLHGDPADIADHLWAAGHGYVSLEISGLLPTDDLRFDRYLRDEIGIWAHETPSPT